MEFVLRGAIVKSRNPDEGKDEVHPRTGHEATEEEERYSCLSLTLALDGGGRSMPHPGCFTPRKETRYPLYRRLGGLQGQSGWIGKTLPPPLGFDPRTAQPAVSHYTTCAIPAAIKYSLNNLSAMLSHSQYSANAC
jgi:hypothetical protein